MQTHKLSVSDLKAGYYNGAVIDGVSFTVDRCDFWGIIGPNGSGKTTLLRCLSRVLKPFAGSILLDGQDIFKLSSNSFARKVSVVPQESWIAFDFSVKDIVLMGRMPFLGRFAVETVQDVKIADDALEMMRISHLADRPITSLSGGERQRVMIARAIAQQPQVMLLDEPTSWQDISFQYEILDIVKTLNAKSELTVIAALHDLNLAAEYCSSLILLKDGKIYFQGSPSEVITSENIKEVYGADVWVRRHPTTLRPYVIAGAARGAGAVVSKDVKVHVIGGGGSAAPLFAKLIKNGYQATGGVLCHGDADREVADILGIKHISEQDFSNISDKSEQEHFKLAATADVIVICDMPIGIGNISNLVVAVRLVEQGKKAIAINLDSIDSRDFTRGRAVELARRLKELGCVQASNVDEVLQELSNWFNQY